MSEKVQQQKRLAKVQNLAYVDSNSVKFIEDSDKMQGPEKRYYLQFDVLVSHQLLEQ